MALSLVEGRPWLPP